MGGRSVRKGKDFERDIARQLTALWDANAPVPHPGAPPTRDVRRGLSQSRGGGAEEADVVVGNLDLHLEVKHDNGISPEALMRQALGDARASRTTTQATLILGVLKRDRQEPVALLFAWDAARLFAWWCDSPAPKRDALTRCFPGPVVRPYAATPPAAAGKAPKGGRPAGKVAGERFDPRSLGPIVRLPWSEVKELLNAVWGVLPRR